MFRWLIRGYSLANLAVSSSFAKWYGSTAWTGPWLSGDAAVAVKEPVRLFSSSSIVGLAHSIDSYGSQNHNAFDHLLPER